MYVITKIIDRLLVSGLGRPAVFLDDEDDDGGFGKRNSPSNEMLTLEQFLMESGKTSNICQVIPIFIMMESGKTSNIGQVISIFITTESGKTSNIGQVIPIFIMIESGKTSNSVR